MRKKKLIMTLLASAMASVFSSTAFAGSWQWIDDDHNGVAECYYFDDNGNMLKNTTTPDGYKVNSNGEWYVYDGVVCTKSSVLEEMAANPNPTSEDIVKYLNVKSDRLIETESRNGYDITKSKNLEIDYSREPVTSGLTNIRLTGPIYENISTSGWYYLTFYGDGLNTYVCMVAFGEGGYLYVNTTTPDGLYVNEYGMLEIDGKPVVHTADCRIFPPSTRSTVPLLYPDGTQVSDRNNVDLNRMGNTLYYMLVTLSLYSNSNVPFGDLVYRHPDFVGISDSGQYIYEYRNEFGDCIKEAEESLINDWSKPEVSGVKIAF